MPNHASAAKRLRQDEQRRLRNKARKTELKTLAKKLQRAVHDKENEQAETLLQRYSKRLDQAASKNVIHKNAAGRRKSSASKAVNGLKAS